MLMIQNRLLDYRLKNLNKLTVWSRKSATANFCRFDLIRTITPARPPTVRESMRFCIS